VQAARQDSSREYAAHCGTFDGSKIWVVEESAIDYPERSIKFFPKPEALSP